MPTKLLLIIISMTLFFLLPLFLPVIINHFRNRKKSQQKQFFENNSNTIEQTETIEEGNGIKIFPDKPTLLLLLVISILISFLFHPISEYQAAFKAVSRSLDPSYRIFALLYTIYPKLFPIIGIYMFTIVTYTIGKFSLANIRTEKDPHSKVRVKLDDTNSTPLIRRLLGDFVEYNDYNEKTINHQESNITSEQAKVLVKTAMLNSLIPSLLLFSLIVGFISLIGIYFFHISFENHSTTIIITLIILWLLFYRYTVINTIKSAYTTNSFISVNGQTISDLVKKEVEK